MPIDPYGAIKFRQKTLFFREIRSIFNMSVILETSVGDITIDLFTEERPICNLFLIVAIHLSRSGF